jgi:hypothetical protein
VVTPETLRGHTLKAGEQLRDAAIAKPSAPVSAITVTVDSTFIRGCHNGERHLEVHVGNVETSGGGRQVFGAVAKADTEIAVMIRRSLETVGQAADTACWAIDPRFNQAQNPPNPLAPIGRPVISLAPSSLHILDTPYVRIV